MSKMLDENSQKNYFYFKKKPFSGSDLSISKLSRYVSASLSRMKVLSFPPASPVILDLRSLHISCLSIALLWHFISLPRLSPLFYSLLLCNPTYHVLWGFLTLLSNHPIPCHPFRMFSLVYPTSFFSHVAYLTSISSSCLNPSFSLNTIQVKNNRNTVYKY